MQASWSTRIVRRMPSGSLETWLLTRSLRTLHLRVGRQCETAASLAAWLHAAAAGEAAHALAGKVRRPSRAHRTCLRTGR
jgi:cystathionine beta-lyase/cystathionine gamma-synthase